MPDSPQPLAPLTVSVVIPTFNRGPKLGDTLRALWQQTLPPERFEIIVVDNSSTDGTDRLVAGWAAESPVALRYLVKPPEGPAAARNLGARHGRGRRIAFVDSDVALAPDWLEQAIRLMDEDPSLGMLGGKLVYGHRPDYLNAFGGEFSKIGLAWDAHEGVAAAAIQQPEPTLWLNCSAALVERSVLETIGGLDERFFYGYEDSDLGWRINLAGYRVLAHPDLLAFHAVDIDTGPASPTIVFHYCKNRLRSLLKNYSTARLWCWLPVYLGYALADGLLRAPRRPKWAALAWNLRHLADTRSRRKAVQAGRKTADSALAALFSDRWFPRVRLDNQRRRPLAQDRSTRSETTADDRFQDRRP